MKRFIIQYNFRSSSITSRQTNYLGTVNHFMTMTDSCRMLSSVHTGDRRDLCASVLFYIPFFREV
jgi:hypothetical protein